MAPKFNEKNFPLTVQVRCPTAPPSTSEFYAACAQGFCLHLSSRRQSHPDQLKPRVACAIEPKTMTKYSLRTSKTIAQDMSESMP
eukprot:3490141-Amphidinium_carterae.1